MEITENETGEASVLLRRGDSLDDVPDSHRSLVSPRIGEVFQDPPAHFSAMAESCPFPRMAAWLRAVIADGDWSLALHRSPYEGYQGAGFDWRSSSVRGAEISLPQEALPETVPSAIRRHYSLVGAVDWNGFGCSGGLYEWPHPSLTEFPGYEYTGADIVPAETFAAGSSPGGDCLIYTQDDRGGWVYMGDGQVHLLGSIEDFTG